jgi:hypothetical protein
MRCPNYGQTLQPDDKFCENCGAPAPLESSPDPYGSPFGEPIQLSPPIDIHSEPVAQQRVASSVRSLTGLAVVTLVLYLIIWIPGLIANLVFWREAVSKSSAALEGRQTARVVSSRCLSSLDSCRPQPRALPLVESSCLAE